MIVILWGYIPASFSLSIHIPEICGKLSIAEKWFFHKITIFFATFESEIDNSLVKGNVETFTYRVYMYLQKIVSSLWSLKLIKRVSFGLWTAIRHENSKTKHSNLFQEELFICLFHFTVCYGDKICKVRLMFFFAKIYITLIYIWKSYFFNSLCKLHEVRGHFGSYFLSN